MYRIVDVEEPFENLVGFGVAASFAVVEGKKRDGQNHTKLDEALDLVQGKEVDGGVYGHIEEGPNGLGFGIAPVRSN